MEKPTFKQRIDGLCKFLYNSEDGTVLGRGGKSWAEIGVFYMVYYMCLAGFFAATIAVFYQTVDADHPKLQGDDSLLKANPGMGYQPMPDIDTTLVLVTKDVDNFKKHREAMNDSYIEVLKAYNKTALTAAEECASLYTERGAEDPACLVDFAVLTSKCNSKTNFGMDEDKPCVLLKLNRIYGWKPDLWDGKDDEGFPDELKDAAKYEEQKMIWIECHGENPADKDNLPQESIKYYPQQGFPIAYYPYLKQKDYRSPLVFVQFEKVTPNIGLMVECKAFAKNIRVDLTDKEGSVHFELLVEDNPNDKRR